MKLSKAEALAIRAQNEIEKALVRRDWSSVRDVAIRLAALAAERAHKDK